jgi:hypothetical protein
MCSAEFSLPGRQAVPPTAEGADMTTLQRVGEVISVQCASAIEHVPKFTEVSTSLEKA